MAAYYLKVAGFETDRDMWEEDELYEFNMKISAGEVRDIDEIVHKLWEWWGVEEVG